MKVIKPIVVILMLLIFPALSWYYLDTGLEYRKQAYQEMLPKESLQVLIDSGKFTTDFDLKTTCENETVLLIGRKNEHNDVTIQRLYDQFSKSYNFQLVLLNNPGLPNLDEFNKEKIFVVPTKSIQDFEIALINNEGQLINEYTFEDEDIKKLVSHTALLLPKEKRKDIKMIKPID